METHDKRSPFLGSVRAAIRARSYRYATERRYLAPIAALQRHAVQSGLGATLRLNPEAGAEQAASRDSDTPKRERPDDD